MPRETITVSLPQKIKKQLDQLTQKKGVTRSDIVRESLRDYLFVREFQNLRAKMTAKAQAQGIFTDEDVYEKLS